MDQTYSIWQMNTGQTSGNVGPSVIAAAPGMRIVNIRGQGTPARLIHTVVPTASGANAFGSGDSDIYQQHPTTVMAEPLLLQIPETRQYLVDESSIQNIDQMPPVNLIMGTNADACDEASVVATGDDDQVFHLTTESITAESTIMQPNDSSCVHGHYAEECEVMEEVITDDWVQSQGEECVQVTVDQLGASTIPGTVEDDISVPLDQDEYTLSRPFPCDFCSRRFRKKASLQNHLVAHSNDRPHVCNLCGAQYGRRIDLTNHFKQHAYEASHLDEGAHRSDQEVDYDIPGLPMPHHSKQRVQHSSEEEDLFNEGTRAVSYNSQPPMQLISSTNSTATSAYACDSAVKLQYTNDPTVDTMNPILEDGSYSYPLPMGGSSRRAHSSATSQSKRQAPRGGKTAPSGMGKGNRRNATNSGGIKTESMIVTNELQFLEPTNVGAIARSGFPVVDERKPFVCQQCGASFGREKALASHSRVHGGDMQYRCSTCDESFWERALLQDHIRQKHPGIYWQLPAGHGGPKRHSSVKNSSSVVEVRESTNDVHFRSLSSVGQYVCDSCLTVFDRPEHLKKHIQVAHSIAPTGACSRTAGSDRIIVKQELRDMLFDVTNGQEQDEQQDIPYVMDDENEPSNDEQATLFCGDCDKTFAKRSDLQAHSSKEHARIKPHECQLCGKKFPNESVIKQHVQECHRGELTDTSCAICGKLCKNQTSLMKHSYDHSRERTHCCSICGKPFQHMGRLKRHMSSHRNKTVHCEVCGEEFPDGRTLMNHRHSHSKSNNYPCKECGKTFGSRSSQQIHLRIHTGERPYACRFCWKAFADGGTLRKHERVHTGEKPYGCSVCPKEFNQRVVLREHIRAHHSQPDMTQGNVELPYYCPVCSTLFSAAVDLVQHLIEHSDSNTAKKRKPPTFPRKYKRRRKLKPHELERLQNGRRKQKSAKDADVEGQVESIEDEADEGDGQYEGRTVSLEREDGTLKTSSELFLEYGNTSQVQKLAATSSEFISPHELLAEGAGSSSGGRARRKDKPDEGMLHNVGINLLSNGEEQAQAQLGNDTLPSGQRSNNDQTESPSTRKGMRSGATNPSKKPAAIGSARMIRTEPGNRPPAAKSKGSVKKSKRRTATGTDSTKELLFAPNGEGASTVGPPEMSSVSHAMEAFSELERKRSRTQPMPSYVREIPSSKISENFPLLDDGNVEDTLEEPLMEGCSSDDPRVARHRYGTRQRYISSTSTASATRDEEDEQLLMEISRAVKYTDRFNSDLVNDLAEIFLSPVKGGPSGASSVPPVDILASPSSRYAVQLPPIHQDGQVVAIGKETAVVARKRGQTKRTAPTPNRSVNKAKVPSAPSSTKQGTNATITAASVSMDAYATSLLYSHGRRLTRRQLEREVSFLSEAYAPEVSHPGPSNGSSEGASEALPSFATIGDERSVLIKLESENVPEKLAAMLLNDGIPIGTESGRCSSSERQEAEHYTVEGEIEGHDRREAAAQEIATNTSGESSSPITSKSNGYRCSICAACFTDRSQLILHVPVHM
uniref:C2H2-type domain-containing protein n=1 Tax=Anopheles atroparvus TaxID=41427 RepID=A0A182IMH6_ANOAO